MAVFANKFLQEWILVLEDRLASLFNLFKGRAAIRTKRNLMSSHKRVEVFNTSFHIGVMDGFMTLDSIIDNGRKWRHGSLLGGWDSRVWEEEVKGKA